MNCGESLPIRQRIGVIAKTILNTLNIYIKTLA